MPSLSLFYTSTGLLSDVLFVSFILCWLPAATLALFYNFAAALVLIPQNHLRRRIRRDSRFQPQTVLVTGISSPVGLRVARAFYQTGHLVVAADWGTRSLWNPYRWSKAVYAFYSVHPSSSSSSADCLLAIVQKERISLWIDCSQHFPGRPQAKLSIEQKTGCVCLVADSVAADKFTTDEHFRSFVQHLGLPVVESHAAQSRSEIHHILHKSNGKLYALSAPNSEVKPQRTILPRRTLSQTYNDVSRVAVSSQKPVRLEQYTGGLQRYTASAIIVNGAPMALKVYSKTTELAMRALPDGSGLPRAMHQYMGEVSRALGEQFASHMAIEFCVEEAVTHSGVVQQIIPISGSLLANAGTLLFSGTRGSVELTAAYMSALSPSENGTVAAQPPRSAAQSQPATTPGPNEHLTFNLVGEIESLVVEPFARLLGWQSGILQIFQSLFLFLRHVVTSSDILYEFWDPFPSYWLYFIYLPICIVWARLTTNRSGDNFARPHSAGRVG